MAQVARHVRVTGCVQGVFYRAWTREQAQALGVHGWVRNCPDGSVEAHAEGDEQAVEQLVERMRAGPAGASVSELTAENVEPEDFHNFSVVHAL
jgi:acylphosphatase